MKRRSEKSYVASPRWVYLYFGNRGHAPRSSLPQDEVNSAGGIVDDLGNLVTASSVSIRLSASGQKTLKSANLGPLTRRSRGWDRQPGTIVIMKRQSATTQMGEAATQRHHHKLSRTTRRLPPRVQDVPCKILEEIARPTVVLFAELELRPGHPGLELDSQSMT